MHIRTVPAVIVAGLLAGSLVGAQGRPDFSGTWTVDFDKSVGQGLPSSTHQTITIKQDATTLTIEQVGVKPVIYRLDGTPVKNPRLVTGGEVVFTSVWQAQKLVTTITGGLPGQKETRYLERDEMVDIAEGRSSIGPTLWRKVYWKRVK
jgi:hypothetical protein